MAETLGRHVLRRRKAMEMTQETLAKRMGWRDRSYLSRIERDEIKSPSMATVVALAASLEESVDDLLSGTGLRDLYLQEAQLRPETPAQERVIAFVRAQLGHLADVEAERVVRMLNAGYGEPESDKEAIKRYFRQLPEDEARKALLLLDEVTEASGEGGSGEESPADGPRQERPRARPPRIGPTRASPWKPPTNG